MKHMLMGYILRLRFYPEPRRYRLLQNPDRYSIRLVNYHLRRPALPPRDASILDQEGQA